MTFQTCVTPTLEPPAVVSPQSNANVNPDLVFEQSDFGDSDFEERMKQQLVESNPRPRIPELKPREEEAPHGEGEAHQEEEPHQQAHQNSDDESDEDGHN